MTIRLLSPQGATGPAELQGLSGLSRPTVLKGLASLTAAGLCCTNAQHQIQLSYGGAPKPWVSLPRDLLIDRRLGVQAKTLYGYLPLTPGYHDRTGQFTYAQLGRLAGISDKWARQTIGDLIRAGWLQIEQANQLTSIHFLCTSPVAARGEVAVAAAQRRLQRATLRGEAIMKEYLSLVVDSDQFEDNAAPGFLVNLFTGERLELDRFYPPNVAFEFNGPQHYGATELFSEEQANMQRGRDYMKLGICTSRKIHLEIIHPQELQLEIIRQRAAPFLPMRDLTGQKPLTDFLESVARRYRRAARNW